MERQLWDSIVDVLTRVCKTKENPMCTFSCVRIVKTWLWSVLHDRPISWACRRENWPIHQRRFALPSNTTMSRRLRSDGVRDLLLQLEHHVLKPRNMGSLVWMMDGKPLTIGGCSKDRQAGYGKAAGAKAKGYKMHAIIGNNGEVAQWRVAPMNKDERVMGRRMLKAMEGVGYVVADGNYDSNKLHGVCDDNGDLQLVARRRYGAGRGLGHRKHAESRLRSKAILEDPDTRFGMGLLDQREQIERFFGNLSGWGGGLTHLPPWVRTWRRVHRWVQAKIVIHQFKRQHKT